MNIEVVIEKCLHGKAVAENDICDFSLANQNEETSAKRTSNVQPPTYVPVLWESVIYVVTAVLINDNDEVLMIQEAHSDYAGQWYLPAGKMVPGEHITEAVQREVLVETGLHFKPTTLMVVQGTSSSWYRFVMTGDITGGKLKTPADANAESLQAKWIKNLGELVLRSNDIILLVNKARAYKKEK